MDDHEKKHRATRQLYAKVPSHRAPVGALCERQYAHRAPIGAVSEGSSMRLCKA